MRLKVLNAHLSYIQPLYLSFNKNVLVSSEKIELSAVAYDILSNPVTLKSIEVKSLVRGGESSSFFVGQFDENFTIDLSSAVKVPGVYSMTIAATVEETKKPIIFTNSFSVVKTMSVKAVHAGITDEKSLEISQLDAVDAPMNLTSGKADASNYDVFHIAFQVSPSTFKAHQTFVVFKHIRKNDDFVDSEAVFVASLVGEYLHVAVSVGTEAEAFSYVSGRYSVSIFVGDSRASRPIEWKVGSIELSFPVRPVKTYALYTKSLLHTSDNTLVALPEITHVMRPPAARASVFMSTLFTALTLLPLIWFIFFTLSSKPDMIYLKSVPSFLFLGCIASALLLYVAYWLALPGFTFYQAIKYICILAPVTAVVGKSALSTVARFQDGDSSARQKTD